MAGLETDELVARLRAAWEAAHDACSLLLVHGDDGFGLDSCVARLRRRIGADDRVEIVPVASPDEAALERRRSKPARSGMFGLRLAVLRQPLRAAGRSTAASERLIALVARPAGWRRAGTRRRAPARDTTNRRPCLAASRRGGRPAAAS